MEARNELSARSVKLKIAAVFALSFLMVGFLGLVSYRSNEALLETGRWVTHTYEVLGRLSKLISHAKDLETATRGYSLTG